jgi:glucose-6-phosphate 1-dehydrogenase
MSINTTPSQPTGPCAIVIFGAAGDLTQRLLIPALYNLLRSNLLSPAFAIVGVARADMSTEDFRSKMRQAIYEFATVEVEDRLLTGRQVA